MTYPHLCELKSITSRLIIWQYFVSDLGDHGDDSEFDHVFDFAEIGHHGHFMFFSKTLFRFFFMGDEPLGALGQVSGPAGDSPQGPCLQERTNGWSLQDKHWEMDSPTMNGYLISPSGL